jgi:hypothetical protein
MAHEDSDDGVTHILAHGMLTSVSVAVAAVKLIVRDDIGADDRRRFGEAAVAQLELVTDILREIARGLPPEALLLLRRDQAAPDVTGVRPVAPAGRAAFDVVESCG